MRPAWRGSAYATIAGAAPEDEPPALDLARESALHHFLAAAIHEGLLSAAQDVSSGGIAVSLAEMAIWGERGASLQLHVQATPAVELFGESPSRAVVTSPPPMWSRLAALAVESGVPLERLGQTGGDRLRVELVGEGATGAAEGRGTDIADPIEADLDSLRHAWTGGLSVLLADA